MTTDRRTIAVLTTSRADYGHLYWPLRHLQDQPNIDLRLIVTGAHLSAEFGTTIREIEADGFPIAAKVECLLSSDSDLGMAKTIGLATISLADVLASMRPDLLLLIADRYEMLAPAAVALALRIPIAHIEGGDVSEGAIDDAVRNALTKMSHLHFTPTELAKRRVLAMGEEPWRVIRSGAPSLDHLKNSQLLDRDKLAARLNFELDPAPLVVAYHPVTLHADTLDEAEAVFDALYRQTRPIVFCFPNADAGSRELVNRARQFCATYERAALYENLNHLDYWALLRDAAALVGNSSSGIMETPSLKLPTVNIGDRQKGRERAANIIDAKADADAIEAAIHQALESGFRKNLDGLVNPYGNGTAGQRIAETLAHIAIDDRLLHKHVPELDESGCWRSHENKSTSISTGH